MSKLTINTTLSLNVTLLLTLWANSYAYADEEKHVDNNLTISPTIISKVSAIDLSSDAQTLNKKDAFNTTLIDLSLDYQGSYISSFNNIHHRSDVYSSNTEYNLNQTNYATNNKIELLRDDLVAHVNAQQYHDSSNIFIGGFSADDDIFASQNATRVNIQNYNMFYVIPKESPLPFALTSSIYVYRSQTHFSEQQPKQPNTLKYGSNQWITHIYRETSSQPGYWSLTYDYLNLDASEDENIYQRNARFNARVPLFSQVNLVGKANYTLATSLSSLVFDNRVEYGIYGIGLGWVKDQRIAFAQVTYDQEYHNGIFTHKDYLSTHIGWLTSRKTRINLLWERQFYGDSAAATFAYQGQHSALNFAYHEKIDVSFFVTPEQQLKGIYFCDKNLDELSPDVCRIADQLNDIPLENEQATYLYDVLYPVNTKLVLNKLYSFDWFYDRFLSQHFFKASHQDTKDLDYSNVQRQTDFQYQYAYHLNDTSKLIFETKYRKIHQLNYNIISRDRLLKLSYNKELNTRAAITFGIQRITKDSNIFQNNYTDDRLFFQYEHFFGRHHKDRRDNPLKALPTTR